MQIVSLINQSRRIENERESRTSERHLWMDVIESNRWSWTWCWLYWRGKNPKNILFRGVCVINGNEPNYNFFHPVNRLVFGRIDGSDTFKWHAIFGFDDDQSKLNSVKYTIKCWTSLRCDESTSLSQLPPAKERESPLVWLIYADRPMNVLYVRSRSLTFALALGDTYNNINNCNENRRYTFWPAINPIGHLRVDKYR